MWLLMKDKADSTRPCSLQQNVIQSFSICTVVPLRKICTTVSPLRGRVNLNIVHTSAAFESARKQSKQCHVSHLKALANFEMIRYNILLTEKLVLNKVTTLSLFQKLATLFRRKWVTQLNTVNITIPFLIFVYSTWDLKTPHSIENKVWKTKTVVYSPHWRRLEAWCITVTVTKEPLSPECWLVQPPHKPEMTIHTTV